MELRQLRYFAALAEELHFGRAASRLHLSPSALSQQVRALERYLQVPLFARSSRRVELTDAGRALYAHAETVLSVAHQAAAAARGAGLAGRQRLTIGFIGNALAELTTILIEGFERALPETEIVLKHLSLAEHLHALRHGRVDLALVRLPIDEPDLDVEVIFAEPRVVVLPAAHRFARAPRLSLADVADDRVLPLGPSFPTAWRDFWIVNPRPDGSRPRLGPPFDNLEEALQLVANGKGVLVAAASLARSQARPDLVFTPLVDVTPSRVGIAWRRDLRSPLVSALTAVARDVLRSATQPQT